MRYFEDFEIGKRLSFQDDYQFTETDIIEFARRWDPQPFHIDKEAAAKSLFGGIVACSSHIITASIGIAAHDPAQATAAVSALGFKEIRILAPVRPGDTLTSVEDVLEKRLSKSHSGCGIISFGNDIFNQDEILVCSFQTAAIIKCRGTA